MSTYNSRFLSVFGKCTGSGNVSVFLWDALQMAEAELQLVNGNFEKETKSCIRPTLLKRAQV